MSDPKLTVGATAGVVLSLALRLTVIALLVVGGYFLAPLGHEMTVSSWLVVVAGLAVIGLLVVFQGRSIVRSERPVLRGAESLTSSALLFLTLFASIYYTMDQGTPSAFTTSLTKLDALYFTVTVFTTVGFGDITAVSETARAIVLVQMVVDLIFIGVAIRVLTAVTRSALRQRRSGGPSN